MELQKNMVTKQKSEKRSEYLKEVIAKAKRKREKYLLDYPEEDDTSLGESLD